MKKRKRAHYSAMEKAHSKLTINNDHFDRFMNHLTAPLSHCQVGEKEITELTALLLI
ncbi:hypothetical protein [Aneurinibacillus terranovensis]|uniref:hypothetical protein n=1 Tax=Aneurinibacillus terranovensis TaxID=278991 RepID=UPI0003F9729D|nr:hypothetical protein [Aneurinibacillus terranovensis]